jgi:VanZ family protein
MNKPRASFNKWNASRWFWIVLLVGWMTLIYVKSNEPYQAQDIRPLLATWFSTTALQNGMPHFEFYYSGELLTWKEPYILIEFFFRKSAHVAEYAVLAVLWLKTLNFTALKRYRMFISPVMAILYSVSDEWHQTYIAGRTGHPIDVAVDTIGVLLIMLLWLGWSRLNRNKGA